jgi:hypothetical protein
MRTQRWRRHAGASRHISIQSQTNRVHFTNLQTILALIAVQHIVCVYSHWTTISTTFCKRLSGYLQSLKGLTETRTCPMYVYFYSQHIALRLQGLLAGCCPYVNLSILKSLFQVLIYGFIRDFANQSKIRDSDLLLLRCIECRFLDVWFAAAGSTASSSRRRIVRSFLSLWATTNTLHQTSY